MRNRITIMRNRIDILDSLPRIIRKSVELIYKYIDSKERAKKMFTILEGSYSWEVYSKALSSKYLLYNKDTGDLFFVFIDEDTVAYAIDTNRRYKYQ